MIKFTRKLGKTEVLDAEFSSDVKGPLLRQIKADIVKSGVLDKEVIRESIEQEYGACYWLWDDEDIERKLKEYDFSERRDYMASFKIMCGIADWLQKYLANPQKKKVVQTRLF